MRIVTLLLIVVAVIASSPAHSHTVSKFVEAAIELPSTGPVGDVDVKVLVRSVWREPVRVDVVGAPRKARGTLLQPGQWIEVLVEVPIGKGPKEWVSVDIEIASARGAPLGRTTANGYAEVDGDRWTRSSYDALYASELVAVSGQSFRQVPGWLAPDATSAAAAAASASSSTISGRLVVRKADGQEIPARDWSAEVRNLTTGASSAPAMTDTEGVWNASIAASTGDLLQLFYRPESEYLRVRPWNEDVYIFSTGRTFGTDGPTAVETLDFSARTGVLPGLVDVTATASAYRAALSAFDLSPDREDPIGVYFPNDRSDCQGDSAWSCGEAAGRIWLAAQHSRERGPLMHELSHQLDYKHHGALRPGGVGESHMVDTCHNPALALEEGFANALVNFLRFGVAGGPPEIESPDKARICNGASNETWVAATFWDLLDTGEDGLDHFHYTNPTDVFRAYLEAPKKESLIDYLPEFRAMADSPSQVDDIFHQNTLRVDFPLLSAGSASGTPYRVVCDGDAYLVGVRGRAGGLLDSLEGVCMDRSGKQTQTPAVGGTGGAPFARRCPEDMLVSGFGGRAGRLFHQLVLECRLASDSALTGPPATLDWVGGDGGREFSMRRCPKGMAGVGFEGHLDRFVNQLALVCDDLEWPPASGPVAVADAETPPAPDAMSTETPTAPPVLPGPDADMIGGAGGAAFAFDCAPGEALAGMELRAGRLIDAIRPLCAEVSDQTTGPPIAVGDFAGGEAGAPARQVCPTGSIVSGIAGRAGKFVNSLQLRCQPLAEGDATLLPNSGGGGGAPFDLLECPVGLHAKGLRGRSGALVDALGLSCGELSAGAPR